MTFTGILRVTCVLSFLVVSWSTSASAEVITGNDWQQKMNRSDRLYYTAGAFNVWWAESHYGDVPPDKRNNSDRMTDCSRKMTYGQLVAIVQKYLDNNPEKWHYELPVIMGWAVEGICPSKAR